MNVQLSTLNVQFRTGMKARKSPKWMDLEIEGYLFAICSLAMKDDKPKYDLEERLLDFSAEIIRLAERLPNTPAGRHVSGQLIRSGTSPMAHHGEAQAAESRNDFVHKMKIGHKELRESIRWIKLIQRVLMVDAPDSVDSHRRENDELIRIFYASIRTAKSK